MDVPQPTTEDKTIGSAKPDWFDADEETFARHLVEPEEDQRRTSAQPWRGGFRWFRSPNVVCIEKERRKRAKLTMLLSMR
jgi:hypothetical protein